MIVADTSALAAIVLGEADADIYASRISVENVVVLGAPTAFELRLAMRRRIGPGAGPRVDAVLSYPNIRIVPFGREHLALATEALARFAGRPAKLNYGDCMAYAIAKAYDAPLLFKGDDFARTDLHPALD